MNEETLICGHTPAQIEALKQEHGHLVLGEVVQGGKTYQAIFKEPTFQVLEATGAISKKDEVKGSRALYDNCVVVADDEIKSRDFLQLKVVQCLAEYMNSFSVKIKNL
jgi:hypothetical protein|nr:MAG TPA: hypothetical protein [Caudoviricetes sp.]